MTPVEALPLFGAAVLACMATAQIRMRACAAEVPSLNFATLVAFVLASLALIRVANGHGSVYVASVVIVLAAGVACTWSDTRVRAIFDLVTIPSLGIVVLLAASSGNAMSAAAGALCGALIPWILHALTNGRAMGLGDVKLAAVFGSALGISGALEVLAVAFVSGAVSAVYLLCAAGAGRKTEIAFGPYLTLGACAVVALGGQNS